MKDSFRSVYDRKIVSRSWELNIDPLIFERRGHNFGFWFVGIVSAVYGPYTTGKLHLNSGS